MSMNKSQRAEHVKQFNAAPASTNSSTSRRVSKALPRMVRKIRGSLRTFSNQFSQIAGANEAARRTTFFDAISAETDGDLILHDFGALLDALLPLANDYRQPDEEALTIPFTDADVTAYLP